MAEYNVFKLEGNCLKIDLGRYKGCADLSSLASDVAANWGSIGGTLSNQSDLAAALALKANTSALSGYLPITGGLLTGTAGNGKITFPTQSSAPSTPASGFSLYANASNALSWKGANGFVRVFDGTTNTADRTYTLPDASGTFGLLGSNQSWTGLNTFGGSTTPTHSITLASTSTGWSHYNTSDQTVNYERARGYWNGNIYNIITEQGGTGQVRTINIQAPVFTLGSASIVLGNGYNTTSQNNSFINVTSTSSATAGVSNFLSLLNTVNQSGTAGYRGIFVSPYEQATGSGSKLLLDLGTNSAANGAGTHTSRFSVDNAGNVAAVNYFTNGGSFYSPAYRSLGGGNIIFGSSGGTTFGTLFSTGRWFFGASPVDDGVSVVNINGAARVQNTLTVSSASGGTGTLAGLGSSTFSIQSNGVILLGTSGSYYLRVDPNGTGVGTGNVANNTSAILQVDSTTKGVRLPVMTTAQKNAISSPATGLIVFDSDLGNLCIFATTWKTITSV
jgi:hypothetical protein